MLGRVISRCHGAAVPVEPGKWDREQGTMEAPWPDPKMPTALQKGPNADSSPLIPEVDKTK